MCLICRVWSAGTERLSGWRMSLVQFTSFVTHIAPAVTCVKFHHWSVKELWRPPSHDSLFRFLSILLCRFSRWNTKVNDRFDFAEWSTKLKLQLAITSKLVLYGTRRKWLHKHITSRYGIIELSKLLQKWKFLTFCSIITCLHKRTISWPLVRQLHIRCFPSFSKYLFDKYVNEGVFSVIG